MRCFLLLTLLATIGLQPVSAAKSPQDSLRAELARTSDPEIQIRIYRNLADLSGESSAAAGYLSELYRRAKGLGQIQPMMEALTDLTVNYILTEKIDSARYFAALAEKYAPEKEQERWCCYLRLRLLMTDLMGDNADLATEQMIQQTKERRIEQESLYEQIEADYSIGTTLYYKDKTKESEEYLLRAMQTALKLPLREGIQYQMLTMRQLARVYNALQDTDKGSEITKQSIAIREKYYEQYEKRDRPFLSLDDFYITSYGALLINIEKMPDAEVRHYLGKLVEMSDRSKNPTHKYNRFMAQYNYSAMKRDLRQSLIYNDSLIRYANQIARYNLPGLYKLNSILHEMLGEDKSALVNLRQSHRLQDSIRQAETQTRYDKLQVEYDVNRLNYEKSQLQIRSRHILLICMGVVLVLFILLCFYLYLHLRQEREMKERMEQHKLRAEESEKLKTAFINSICHEIRTPLNGIVGFAGLLFDPSLEEEERSTFPAEIKHNTDQLVSLIDSMLEVANLDVSEQQLPREEVDLTQLCREAAERATPANARVQSILSLPDTNLCIQTHRRYLSMVIDNLLSNAYKFTDSGSVTLSCVRSAEGIEISISDTGCGIPADKQEAVFERFIKLNIHKPGSGLGLYLCKQIIRRLAGSIRIDDSYDNGTRVVVTLPFEK